MMKTQRQVAQTVSEDALVQTQQTTVLAASVKLESLVHLRRQPVKISAICARADSMLTQAVPTVKRASEAVLTSASLLYSQLPYSPFATSLIVTGLVFPLY